MKFRVIDTKTGKEPDLREIALNEDWAKRLIYCDMEGFAIEDDGTLMLVDECGAYAYCPLGRFKVVPDFSALVEAARKYVEVQAKFRDCHSVDMGGMHGVSIHVPQGKRGKEYHDAEQAFWAALAEFKDQEPDPPTEAEINAFIEKQRAEGKDPYPITEETFKKLEEAGKDIPDLPWPEDDDL